MSRLENDDRPSRIPDWLVFVTLVEAGALGISLIMPITPSKTGSGSTWSPASLLTPDPIYLETVGAWFVVTHLLLVVLGLVAWVVSKRS